MDDPIAWFRTLPPITRTWFGLSLVCTVACTLDVVPPSRLLFDWHRIRTDLELWRLVTSFCFPGGTLQQINALICLYLIVIHGRGYEARPLNAGGGRTADCALAYLFCIAVILVAYPLVNLYGPLLLPHQQRHGPVLLPLFTSSLIHCIMYLWSRQNPEARVDLNFIPMAGKYLPFASVGIGLCLGNRINESIYGIAVGHLYYCLVEVLPKLFGIRLLTAPQFLVELVAYMGYEHEHRMMAEDVGGYDSDDDVGLPPRPLPNRGAQGGARVPDDGATVAHIAAKAGNVQVLRDMVAVEGDEDGPACFQAQDANGWQPIHEAARGGHLDVVNFLVEHGVDLNARPNGGKGATALWWAETTHGPDHLVSRRLRELGAVKIEHDREDGDR